VIAQSVRVFLQFLSAGFATIEMEERIEVHPGAKNRSPRAIPFHYEPFKGPKTALLKRLFLRDQSRISFLFSKLETKNRAGTGISPFSRAVKL
jgi:hypothetical protein